MGRFSTSLPRHVFHNLKELLSVGIFVTEGILSKPMFLMFGIHPLYIVFFLLVREKYKDQYFKFFVGN